MRRLLVVFLFTSMVGIFSLGCTGFRLVAKDGTLVAARTLEFDFDLQSEITLVPRGTFMKALTTGWQGLSWIVKYGYVGVDALGMDLLEDGLNEVGLAAGAFYFDQCAGYQELKDDRLSKTISQYDLVGWLLGNFATVEEVKKAIGDICVYGFTVAHSEILKMPLHYIVYDAKGDCVVIEYIDGKLHLHDNPLGVITNNPPFDWHLQNLSNYVNLSPVNIKSSKLGGFEIKAIGGGTGLLGLPGDNTSPSRFVRATFYSHGEIRPSKSDDAVTLAWHILNALDIPEGLVVNEVLGLVVTRHIAYWSAVRDLTNRVYYYRTYKDMNIRMVDLKRIDFDSGPVRFIPMSYKPQYIDETDLLK
jgi:choloylglycine hydrolase